MKNNIIACAVQQGCNSGRENNLAYSIQQIEQAAKQQAELAAQRAASSIAGLPDSQFKDSLLQLSAFAVDRNH